MSNFDSSSSRRRINWVPMLIRELEGMMTLMGSDREHRPPIHFQINPVAEQKRGRTAKPWYYKDQIVLDADNHPVKDYPEIPLACSSQMEGYNMEAIRRLNPRIGPKDFRARIPHHLGSGKQPMWSISAISMRMVLFRELAGCLSWTKRAGSDVFECYLVNLLPAPCVAASSTQGFRDLTGEEILAMQLPDKGNFKYRARNRAAISPSNQTEGSALINDTILARQESEIAAKTLNNKRKRCEAENAVGDGQGDQGFSNSDDPAHGDPEAGHKRLR
ncbi:MAG: hypothetical protein Q9187_002910 [Circinaria calcarea]